MKTKIIKELCQIAEIMHGKQKTYYEQMLADATPVRITPLSEVFDEETIRMIKEAIDPQTKQCYQNATMLCEMFKGIVSYVEGRYTVCGLFSTEHAWNKIEDKYIDITAELAWDSLKPISLYDNPEDKRNFNRRVDDYVYYRNLSKGRNTKSPKYFINQKDL